MGIIHKNFTPKQQAAEVARVKRYESGLLRDPITVSPDASVREVVALAPLLAKGSAPIIANVSSELGSIANTASFHAPSYAISKAALNMATVLLARALKDDGVRVVALHPGWVRTDMGGSGADIDVETSIAGMRAVIDGAGPPVSGHFFDYTGKEIPW